MKPPGRILVATDFSEVADHALDAAGVFAQKLGAEVVIAHVRGALDDAAFGDLPPEMSAYASALQARLAREEVDAAKALEARAARLPSGVVVRTRTLVGRPAHALVDEARDCKADLVVLGTHGRGAVGRAVLGSVAHEVLRSAPCPVLLLGPHG